MSKKHTELELEIAEAQLEFLKKLAVERLLSPEEAKLYDVCAKYLTAHKKHDKPKDIQADFTRESSDKLLKSIETLKLEEPKDN